MGKAKHITFLIIFHLFVLTLVTFIYFKYSEEAVKLKTAIYCMVQSPQVDSDIDFTDYPVMTHTGNEWYQKNLLVYHAGGGIDGLDYTNSKEALELTLSNENYAVEIDFSYTSDHELVCMHDWNVQWGSDVPPSLREFTSRKIYGRYSTMTAVELIQYMEAFPELYIIIDTKEDDQIEVVKDLIDLSSYNTNITERFIIQLYSSGIKEQIQELYPFRNDNFLFTAYKFGSNFPNKIMALCYDENISVITYPYNAWDEETKKLFVSKNFILYEHTVNRPDYADQSLREGVHGFYTDFLSTQIFGYNW